MPTPSGDTGLNTSPVLLLKTKSTPRDGYAEYFSSLSSSPTHHYEPRFVPVLEHKFHDANLAAVKELCASGTLAQRYGGLIFTSQRAVEGFGSVLRHIQCACPDTFMLYSVGPATYGALVAVRDAHLPQAQVIGEEAGTGEILSSIIIEHYNNVYEQKRKCGDNAAQTESHTGSKLPLLFLVGEQHRDVIPKTLMSRDLPADRRIEVEELIVYETGVMESFETAIVDALRDVGAWEDELQSNVRSTAAGEERERNEGPHNGDEGAIWIVIFSPTGCDTLLRTLNLLPSNNGEEPKNARLRRNCHIATIGPTTRDHLRSKFGVQADVCAERPSPESLGEGIETFMARRRR